MKNYAYLVIITAFFITSCASHSKIQPVKKSKITNAITNTKKVQPIIKKTVDLNNVKYAKLKKFKVYGDHFPAYGQDERIRFLILHYTAMENEPSIRVLTQKEVSSHYLVPNSNNDSIYLFVDEDKRSWHAGRSYWKGINNINFSSIGIEIVNLGYTTQNKLTGNPDDAIVERIFYDFTDLQVKKVAELSKDIIERYNISPENVLGHSDIAPQRKHDPGPKFPWKKLYNDYGIGAWYDEYDKNSFLSIFPYNEMDSYSFITSVQKEFEKYGYEVEVTGTWDEQTKKLITVFQYHFRPERYDGLLDAETWSILKALNKKYR